MKAFQFESYTLEPQLRQLRRGDEVVPLTRKAFDLLQYFAENAGRPLKKTEILGAVWPDTFVEESNLNQNVFVLRRALGADGDRLIVTLPRLGYQFTGLVTQSPGALAPPQAIEVETFPTRTTATELTYEEQIEDRFLLHRSPAAWAIAAAALLLLAAVCWVGWQRWEDHAGGPPVQVVVADLDGTTGDAVLDRTLSNVLKIEMVQSPFVNVVPDSKVRSTMGLMMHKPEDPVTGQVARDVCERTDSQAVLHLAVARAGSRYLITEDATNCANGNTMATASQDVDRIDDLPQAIMKNGASIRHTLGESRRMIERFNHSLVPVATGSMEALKDYSQAGYLGQHGRYPESLELLKQAVAIDPHFAAAYLNLGVISSNMGDFDGAKGYIRKAYELRGESTEPNRLFITAYYHQEITEDLDEAVRNYQVWIDLYPRQPQPWAGMAEAYRQMGRQSEAAEANQHTLQLLPNQAIVYYGLANAQMRSGNLAAAVATCRLGIARHLDGENVRLTLLRLGHLLKDDAMIGEQETWLKQHPDSPLMLINQGNFAQNEGRMKDAQSLFDEAWAVYTGQGAPAAISRFEEQLAVTWWNLGEPELARKYLDSGPFRTEYDTLRAVAEMGASEKAESLLRDYLASRPQSTMWNRRYAPLLRGECALMAHKSQEALTLMEPARQYDGASLDGYYLRGLAYLQANQLPQAEAEFRNLLAHAYIEPAGSSLPLARLQLARILAREGKNAASAETYRGFLDAWKNADPGQALPKIARAELAELTK